ncbi:unnamed protein product, partial [Phaeothamnion confervicola]
MRAAATMQQSRAKGPSDQSRKILLSGKMDEIVFSLEPRSFCRCASAIRIDFLAPKRASAWRDFFAFPSCPVFCRAPMVVQRFGPLTHAATSVSQSSESQLGAVPAAAARRESPPPSGASMSWDRTSDGASHSAPPQPSVALPPFQQRLEGQGPPPQQGIASALPPPPRWTAARQKALQAPAAAPGISSPAAWLPPPPPQQPSPPLQPQQPQLVQLLHREGGYPLLSHLPAQPRSQYTERPASFPMERSHNPPSEVAALGAGAMVVPPPLLPPPTAATVRRWTPPTSAPPPPPQYQGAPLQQPPSQQQQQHQYQLQQQQQRLPPPPPPPPSVYQPGVLGQKAGSHSSGAVVPGAPVAAGGPSVALHTAGVARDKTVPELVDAFMRGSAAAPPQPPPRFEAPLPA